MRFLVEGGVWGCQQSVFHQSNTESSVGLIVWWEWAYVAKGLSYTGARSNGAGLLTMRVGKCCEGVSFTEGGQKQIFQRSNVCWVERGQILLWLQILPRGLRPPPYIPIISEVLNPYFRNTAGRHFFDPFHLRLCSWKLYSGTACCGGGGCELKSCSPIGRENWRENDSIKSWNDFVRK